MKKLIFTLLFGSSLVLAKVNCVVSILPQKSFTKAIGGDKVSVTVMVPVGQEPHTYEPKPSQMKEISKADLYFTLDVPFEKPWLPKLKNQNSKMKIINVANGIKKIAMGGKEGEENGGLDPHIWTSPKNIKTIAKNIYKALLSKDPANSDFYKKNYETLIAKIDKTDEKIKNILAKTPKETKFMVFHPAWGYFAKEYSLVQLPIEIEGKEPKPKQMINLIKEAKANGVKAIFTEPEFSQKVAKQIAKELNIPVIALSPLNPDWSSNLIKLAKAIAQQ